MSIHVMLELDLSWTTRIMSIVKTLSGILAMCSCSGYLCSEAVVVDLFFRSRYNGWV